MRVKFGVNDVTSQFPVIPFLEVVGKGACVVSGQKGAAWSKVGVTGVVTVTATAKRLVLSQLPTVWLA